VTTSDHPGPIALQRYWDDRAQRFAGVGDGLAAVCSYGMPSFYNGYIQLTQRAALRHWLRPPPGTTVLEIGCGVGRWSRQLAVAGARVTGVDLSSHMIAEAGRRAAATGVSALCEFIEGDAAQLDLGRRFDRILCVTVLQHIVHPDRMQAALDSMRRHLAPGGRLVLLEAAPSAPDHRCDSGTFIARPESCYRTAFASAGLRCLTTSGVDPLPLKSRLLPRYRALPPSVATTALFGITLVSLPFDVMLAPLMPTRSWHKVFVLTAA